MNVGEESRPECIVEAEKGKTNLMKVVLPPEEPDTATVAGACWFKSNRKGEAHLVFPSWRQRIHSYTCVHRRQGRILRRRRRMRVKTQDLVISLGEVDTHHMLHV